MPTLRSARAVNAVSIFIAAGLVATIVLALEYGSSFTPEKPSVVTVREIDVGLPPPPPPPPPEPRQTAEDFDPVIAMNLSGESSGPNVQFSARPKLANVTLEQLPELDMDQYVMDLARTMSKGIRSFKVEQLDETPRIISSRQSRIAPELREEGIRLVEAQVDILIDTRGEAHIRRIVDAGYPEMVPVIREHIDAIEFTVPKKNGKPVIGEYLFTIRFREIL